MGGLDNRVECTTRTRCRKTERRVVRHRAAAREDLRAIADYYGAIDPDVAARMLEDIEQAIALLQEHPYIGQPLARRGLRGKLTRRYRYKIVYRVTRERSRSGAYSASRTGMLETQARFD